MEQPTKKFLDLAIEFEAAANKMREMCEAGLKLCEEGKTMESLIHMKKTMEFQKDMDKLKRDILIEMKSFDPNSAYEMATKFEIDIGWPEKQEAPLIKVKPGDKIGMA